MFYPDELDKDSRADLTQALGSLMSQISEQNIAARWPFGQEERLPRELAGIAGEYSFTDSQAGLILAIAAVLGHWAKLDRLENNKLCYEPYHPQSVKWDDDEREWLVVLD